jgi:hypothetical protein
MCVCVCVLQTDASNQQRSERVQWSALQRGAGGRGLSVPSTTTIGDEIEGIQVRPPCPSKTWMPGTTTLCKLFGDTLLVKRHCTTSLCLVI